VKAVFTNFLYGIFIYENIYAKCYTKENAQTFKKNDEAFQAKHFGILVDTSRCSSQTKGESFPCIFMQYCNFFKGLFETNKNKSSETAIRNGFGT